LNFLEVIDVEHQQAEGGAAALEIPPGGAQFRVESSAVSRLRSRASVSASGRVDFEFGAPALEA